MLKNKIEAFYFYFKLNLSYGFGDPHYHTFVRYYNFTVKLQRVSDNFEVKIDSLEAI